MHKDDDCFDSEKYIIKTAMTPEELAKFIGADAELIGSDATRAHVLFLPQVEVDAAYKRRWEDLCQLLDELNEHKAKGNLLPAVESCIARCLEWAMDEMQLMDVQQKKLTKWLMEANAEVAQLRKSEEAARGGKAKFANDPRAKAKKDALELWPEANGKGWTAAQFHTALTKKGHVIAYDTARKWMTSLRKTGVC